MLLVRSDDCALWTEIGTKSMPLFVELFRQAGDVVAPGYEEKQILPLPQLNVEKRGNELTHVAAPSL
jgi:hypothetical protein